MVEAPKTVMQTSYIFRKFIILEALTDGGLYLEDMGAGDFESARFLNSN